jgi:hypothetical protein
MLSTNVSGTRRIITATGSDTAPKDERNSSLLVVQPGDGGCSPTNEYDHDLACYYDHVDGDEEYIPVDALKDIETVV